jgi:DNA end-binding protein Ku
MARAIWSGAVSFGLVSIPVKLFNAVSRKSVSFNQLEAKTGARVRQKLVSSVDGEEVTRDQVIKGYSMGGEQYVQVGDDELASIMPTSQRTIELEEFVDLVDIDPVFYDSAYWLVPDQAAVKPYALLSQAMEEAQKVGVARFVMRSKQYVAAIRPRDGKLVLSTMVYADELTSVDDLAEIESAEGVQLNEREVAMAVQLVESLSADFEPEKYRDTYREQVLDLIERKAAGEVVAAPAPVAAEDSKVVDLLAALEASVEAAKASRGNHPATRAAEGKVGARSGPRRAADDDVEEEAEPVAAKARKPRARKSA